MTGDFSDNRIYRLFLKDCEVSDIKKQARKTHRPYGRQKAHHKHTATSPAQILHTVPAQDLHTHCPKGNRFSAMLRGKRDTRRNSISSSISVSSTFHVISRKF